MQQSSLRVIDIVTPFYRVRDDCAELKITLRSVARNLPFIRKVWIFGDRPDWLAADRAVIEHIPHGYLAPLLGFVEPVRSEFRMLLLASLIPGLAFDFLWNADDQIVLEPLSQDDFLGPALHFSTVD